MELNITNGVSCGAASGVDAEWELIWERRPGVDKEVTFTLRRQGVEPPHALQDFFYDVRTHNVVSRAVTNILFQ